MFRYYKYGLIESNRSYSTKRIQQLLGINPQTIRGWVKAEKLAYVSNKPIIIYGSVLKCFIKQRNEEHKKKLNFNEMKCLKCKGVSVPKNNEISIYYNKNRSIRAVGICQDCDNEFSKLYKKNMINELKNSFFIKPIVRTLYNTSHDSNKAHLDSSKKWCLGELSLEVQNKEFKKQYNTSTNTNIKVQNISSKTHIKQLTLFDFYNDD